MNSAMIWRCSDQVEMSETFLIHLYILTSIFSLNKYPLNLYHCNDSCGQWEFGDIIFAVIEYK